MCTCVFTIDGPDGTYTQDVNNVFKAILHLLFMVLHEVSVESFVRTTKCFTVVFVHCLFYTKENVIM